MSSESPVVELYSSDGYELSAQNNVALPLGTRGLISAGYDGTTVRFILIDGSARQVMVGAGTAGTPAGGVVSIQGVAGGTAVPVSGTVTANAGTGSFTVVQATAANLNATVVQGTAANLRTQTASEAATAATTPTVAGLAGGAVTTAAPTYTTGQMDPLSLTTTGLLRIDGSGVTQPVSGTVTANQGTANSLANAWSMKITDATNGPAAVKPASTAAVATDPALVVAISPNNALSIATADTTGTGTLNALNATATVVLSGHNTVGMQLLAGTLIGTIVPEISLDGGTTWVATFFDDPATSNKSSSIVFGTANTATTRTIIGAGGASNARVRVSAFTSGTATCNLRATQVTDPTELFGGAAGSALPPVVAQVGGSVTTAAPTYTTATINALSLTTGGLLRIDGSGVTQPVSGTVTANAGTGTFTVGGTVTANQGTANTLANAWSTKITDATNGPAAVKAASTAAIATDPALVVAISPNNSILVTTTNDPVYGTNNQSITITLTSLASAAARASTAVSNTTSLYTDILLFFKIKTGATGTSATGYINVYGYGSVDGGTTYPEGITGTDAGVTLTSPPNLVIIAQINTVANATTYTFGPISFCRMYGIDKLPAQWGVVVVNQSGHALDTSAGGTVTYQGVN